VKIFLQRRIVHPVITLLKQGITPEKIALSLACGIVVGVFPVMGSTTLLCGAIALAFRLNQPAIQVVNYLMYPVQLLLIVPFIRAGKFLLRQPQQTLSLKVMLVMVQTDLRHSIHYFWQAALQGIFAWTLCAPLAIAVLYLVFAWSLRKTAERIHRVGQRSLKAAA